MDQLRRVSTFLSNHQDKYELFDIEGHTNRTGSFGYNMRLSKRRSEYVRRYLTSKGVAMSKFKPRGYGFTRPYPNTRPEDGINRRVMLIPRGQNDLVSVADEFNQEFSNQYR